MLVGESYSQSADFRKSEMTDFTKNRILYDGHRLFSFRLRFFGLDCIYFIIPVREICLRLRHTAGTEKNTSDIQHHKKKRKLQLKCTV